MARQKEIYILSERKMGSAESFLPAGAFTTNEKMNAHMSALQGYNDGTLEFRIDLLTIDPTMWVGVTK